MSKRKGLPPIQKGPTMMVPSIAKAPETDAPGNLSTFEEQALVIDPNLLVGPVYDNSKSRAKALKDKLGDINTRLTTTLTSFDSVDSHDEEMLHDLEKHVQGMETGQMKATLNHFINNYRDMSTHINESTQQREDILYQLSDWFTLDHLDDLEQGPVSEAEVKSAEDNYSSALVNFEKFKRIQSQIKKATQKGLSTDHLMSEKKKLEGMVMQGFGQVTGKAAREARGGTVPDTTWKHAADEVVTLLRKVRAENADELETLKNKVEKLIMDLKQKSESHEKMQKELREKKLMLSRFADDNSDLNDEVAKLRFRIKKLEVNLANATMLLEKQIDLKAIELPKMEEEGTGRQVAVTLSLIMKQLGAVTDENNLQRLTSDPSILRKQIRENGETIEAFSKELIKLHGQLEEMKETCEQKEALLSDLETVNSELRSNLLNSRSEESFSKKFSAFSITGSKMMLSPHQCNHCKCHSTSSRHSLADSVKRMSSLELHPPSESNKSVETAKLHKKLEHFRNALVDAELKLSEAYREMAKMRKKNLAMPISGLDIHSSESSVEEDKTFKFQEPDKDTKKKIVKEPKKVKKSTRRKSIKPKSKKEKALPPISQAQAIPEPEEPPPPELEDDHENKLWQVGDIQGRMNALATAIIAFVTDIAKMLEKGEDEQGNRHPQMTEYRFGKQYGDKSLKNAINQKMSESKQQRSQVMLNGHRAVAILREAYDILSTQLNLQHEDLEMIYRSFKKHQQLRAIHHAAMMGRLPTGHTVMRMSSNEDALDYYMKSYRGKEPGGANMARGREAQPWEVFSSRVKDHPVSETSSKASDSRQVILKDVVADLLTKAAQYMDT